MNALTTPPTIYPPPLLFLFFFRFALSLRSFVLRLFAFPRFVPKPSLFLPSPFPAAMPVVVANGLRISSGRSSSTTRDQFAQTTRNKNSNNRNNHNNHHNSQNNNNDNKDNNNNNNQINKRRRKKPRALRGKTLTVLHAHDLEKVHQTSLSPNPPHVRSTSSNRMSRAQRDFAHLLASVNSQKPSTNPKTNKPTKQVHAHALDVPLHQLTQKKAEETQHQYLQRLKEQSRSRILAIQRRDNPARLKKRAYYQRREERMQQRKKKRRGDASDSDVEEDVDTEGSTAPGVSLSQLPAYWQERVRNNGQPISKNKRKRLQQQRTVDFGQQAQRPPKLHDVVIRHKKART